MAEDSGIDRGLNRAGQVLGIVNALKSAVGGGGNDADPELVALQQQVARALLSQMQSNNAVTTPFHRDLSELLRQRTGQRLPIRQVAIPTGANRFNPLGNATRRGNITPASLGVPQGGFLGGRTQRPQLTR